MHFPETAKRFIEIITKGVAADAKGQVSDTHLTFTPKLKNRYHPLVAILFVLFG